MKAGEHVVFVAKKKHRRSHVLLRAFRHESLDGCEWDCSSESANKLLLARKPEDFILAVGSLLPLSADPLSSEEADFHPRAQTVRQFKLDHENLYEPVSEIELEHELATLKEDASRLNKNSLRRVIDSYDAMRGGAFLRFLETARYEDEDIVVAEPVQDWLVAKTLLGTIVTFQACLNHAEHKETLENLPRSDGRRAFEGSEHWDVEWRARPLAYNSESLGLVKSGNLPPDGGLLALHFDLEAGTMRNAEYVKLLQGDELPSSAKPVCGVWKNETIDKTLFLSASAALTEAQLASDFICSLLTTARNAESAAGRPIGWSLDYSTAVREGREPKATFHSQWSRLLLETAFHSNKLEAGLCKNCARPMLSKTRGMRRMFCSDSCRVAFTKSYRKETQAIETNAVL